VAIPSETRVVVSANFQAGHQLLLRATHYYFSMVIVVVEQEPFGEHART
jgi:hypothetical protein